MAINTQSELHRTHRYPNPNDATARDTSISLWSVLVILAVAALGYIAYIAYFGTSYTPTSDTIVAPMVDNSRTGTTPVTTR